MVTAKKVVEETVEVVVTPAEEGEEERVKLVSSSKTSNENVDVVTSPLADDDTHQEEDETQPYEPETAPTPPPKEGRPPPKSGGTETRRQEKRDTRKGKAEEEKVKQVEGGGEKKKKRRRKSGGGEEYKRYLYKVMKQVHPEMGISGKAMTIINNLMTDMFERIAVEAAALQKYTGRRTMSSREIQGAVKLVLPGELGKHAIAEGTKAVTNYVSHTR